MEARFTEILVFNQEAGDEHTVVQFTLQGKDGSRFKFRQLGFVDFVTRAAEMVRPPFRLTNTDQLLGTWFWLGEDDPDFPGHPRTPGA